MMYGCVPATLMRVLTEREGLQPLPAAQTWQERWQWWTERPLMPEAGPAPAWREYWQRWMGRLPVGAAAPVPGRRELSPGEACPQVKGA
jgi:hypothetical protein